MCNEVVWLNCNGRFKIIIVISVKKKEQEMSYDNFIEKIKF